jgi:hypothetical protein
MGSEKVECVLTSFICVRMSPVVGCRNGDNETLGLIKSKDFHLLNLLSFQKKYSQC